MEAFFSKTQLKYINTETSYLSNLGKVVMSVLHFYICQCLCTWSSVQVCAQD